MRILLDGCVPARLRFSLPNHAVATVHELGWSDLDDGPLLNRMAGSFDALVTSDKSIPKQQVIAHRPFGVVILCAKTNRLEDLVPLVPQLVHLLEADLTGQVHELTNATAPTNEPMSK